MLFLNVLIKFDVQIDCTIQLMLHKCHYIVFEKGREIFRSLNWKFLQLLQLTVS